MKILILNSGRLQISRYISLVGTYPSARDMGRHNSFVGYAACRYLLLFGNHKTNVLSDMLSDSIKYKDLRSEKHTYKSKNRK